MNNKLDKILRILLPPKMRRLKICWGGIYAKNRYLGRLKSILYGRIVFADLDLDRPKDYVRQMERVFELVKIDCKDRYVYPFDPLVFREVTPGFQSLGSMTPDFLQILRCDIELLKKRIIKCKDTEFVYIHLSLIQSIENLAKRIRNSLDNCSTERASVLKGYFPDMLYRDPRSLDEAIQKLLFFNSLFWQANHWHIGLGRLDMVLYPYYIHDIENKKLRKSDAEDIIKAFLSVLSKDTRAKSPELYGDTGQYIMLGGIAEDGSTLQNDLTEIFIELFKQFHKPDPKLILRVNKDTNSMIWNKAVECLALGTGSPLIMNEKVIIDNMVKFGYDKEDVYNVGTSACWEPLVIGKSSDQNNILPSIIALQPLNEIVLEVNEYINFEQMLADYMGRLKTLIFKSVHDVSLDCSPLFTLFYDNCIGKERDFSNGGTKYTYHGVQIVSFPNLINALLNIKKFVFEEKLITLKGLATAIANNYKDDVDMLILLKSNELKFGSTNVEVLALCNQLMTFIGECLEVVRINGEKVKVGFSSPNYIFSSRGFEASADGRKKSDPFAVHISPLSSNVDIVEIMHFATKLNYEGNRINGNVVDFTIPQSYIQNLDKLRDLLKISCENGLFETQLNVLNYKQLLDAKQNPEKYPDLIVRVWGFSAYFNDLPELYKDNLIERARMYEST